MLERMNNYLCDLLDGKKSFDWSLLALIAFLVFGLGVTIRSCISDRVSTGLLFDPQVRFVDLVDAKGAHRCIAITQQDLYGGYSYDVNCKNLSPALTYYGATPD
jgi:hypothetical protein